MSNGRTLSVGDSLVSKRSNNNNTDNSVGVDDIDDGGGDDEVFSSNILLLHERNKDVPTTSSPLHSPHHVPQLRSRSGSLVPENSPWILSSPMGSNILDDKRSLSLDSQGNGKGSSSSSSSSSRGGGSSRAIQIETTELENLAFLLISFCYMVPWTSLGSLISYFKHTYNAAFYNKLYCAYYLPGLPVAYLQHRYDTHIDLKLGSRNAYLARGTISFIIMVGILVGLVWWRDQNTLIFLFAILGVFGWLCHGTASMLASMYPATAIAYLQTGFRCPEIYTIAIVAALNIGSHPSDHDLDLFFCVTAFIVSGGLIVWIFVAGSSTSRRYFDLKDERMRDLLGKTHHGLGNDHKMGHDMEKSPLLGRSGFRNLGGGGGGDGAAAGRYDKKNVDDNFYDNGDDNDVNTVSAVMESGSATEIARGKRASLIQTQSILRAMEDATMRQTVYLKVFSLCLALFITIWCSIFQASFFAYCDSPQGRDIEQILYFVRLFSDLLGRPLTRLSRPWFLQKGHHLLTASIARVLLMVLFFLYIFIRNFPKSDLFISWVVGVFSALSGYLTVLIYEYAADGLDGAAQTYATGLLNMSFQLAAFTAVSLSVLITSSGWMDAWLPS